MLYLECPISCSNDALKCLFFAPAASDRTAVTALCKLGVWVDTHQHTHTRTREAVTWRHRPGCAQSKHTWTLPGVVAAAQTDALSTYGPCDPGRQTYKSVGAQISETFSGRGGRCM